MKRGTVTPQMRLRVPDSREDHEWLVELHNDPQVLRNLTDPRPITLAGHMAWWSSISSRASERRLLFEVGGDRAGFTKFYAIDSDNRSCVLGADIHRTHRGKGLAMPMWTMMLDMCFSQSLRLHRVGLTTAEYNSVARKVYADLGFKEEGRLEQSLFRDNRYYDQVCMRLFAHEWRESFL